LVQLESNKLDSDKHSPISISIPHWCN